MEAMILTPCHTPFGGVEEIVSDLAQNLSPRGWDVVLGLVEGAVFNKPAEFLAVHSRVRAVAIDGRSGTEEGRVKALVRMIRRIRPDLVLSARIYDAYEAAARLKEEIPELRFAVTIQSYEPDYLVDLEKWAAQVDLCVTSGNLIRRAAIDLCDMEEDRVISIPGGVKGERLERTWPRVGGPLRLGYAGRLDPKQKRVMDLAEIARVLEQRRIDFTLTVVGTGPGEVELRNALDGLQSQARIIGWMKDEREYVRFLRGLDVFLHCSEREGVSIAPREAMLQGAVPVVSEFIGFWTEGHFRPGDNCLSFPVGDCVAAADCIERLAGDEGLLGRLSRNAAESQQGIYSAEGALEAWARAFNAAMEMEAKKGFRPVKPKQVTGRLSRWRVPDSVAQALRDLTGRRHVHSDAGSEWPHRGPFCTQDDERRFEEFAADCDHAARLHVFGPTGRKS